MDLLAWVVEYFEFKLLCAVKVHSKLAHVWNVKLLWSCLLCVEVLSDLWVITGAAFQVFTNRNTLVACQATLPLVRLCVPREGCAHGFGCALICKRNARVWIRLLGKVNLPSWFGEIAYWLTYCPCLKSRTNELNSCVCVVVCLVWISSHRRGKKTLRADPGESFNSTLQRDVTSGSLFCWAYGLLHLTSFLQVNGLITRVRVFLLCHL